MGGVSELSIGKVVLGFAVVFAYAGYCLYLVRRVGVLSSKSNGNAGITLGGTRVSNFRRRARFASQDGVEETSGGRGGIESVVIGIDLDKETK